MTSVKERRSKAAQGIRAPGRSRHGEGATESHRSEKPAEEDAGVRKYIQIQCQRRRGSRTSFQEIILKYSLLALSLLACSASATATSVCVSKSTQQVYFAGDKDFERARLALNTMSAQSMGVVKGGSAPMLIGADSPYIKITTSKDSCGAEIARSEKLCEEIGCEDTLDDFHNSPLGARVKFFACAASIQVEYEWTRQSNGRWIMTSRVEVVVDQCPEVPAA